MPKTEERSERRDIGRIHGRGHEHDAPPHFGRRDAVGSEQHRLHLLCIDDQHDDDIARASESGRRVRRRRTVADGTRLGFRPDCPAPW
jgi:hypothetical protein